MTLKSTDQIGNVIRNGLVFNIENWIPENHMDTDDLFQSIQELFTLLNQREIEYVLVGGIALLNYIEGRNTQDLDLIMSITSLQRVPELKIISQDSDFIRVDYKGLQVEILSTKNRFFKMVLQKYSVVQKFLDRNIPIVKIEGLILLKLYSLPSLYRQANFARVGIYENDIATMLHYYKPDLEWLTSELAKYLDPKDMIEINNILTDIKHRLDRFTNHE